MRPRTCAALPRNLILVAVLAVGACSYKRDVDVPRALGTPYQPYMIGSPYQIGGRWYYPREDFDYDRTGIASWYGPTFHGRVTANGETYDMNAMTAAHPTLPMPTIVQVRNLENGRSIIARINDRGPFVGDRVIDLSRAGARALGIDGQGLAQVRVTVLKEASLRLKMEAAHGTAVATRPAPPEPIVAVAARYAPAARAGRIFIQAGAYADRRRAERESASLARVGPTEITPAWIGDNLYYRIRIGPARDVGEGDEMLARVVERGFTEARVVVE